LSSLADKNVIMGLDLMPGCAPESEPRYSAVVLKGGKVIEKKNDIGIIGLYSLIKRYKPDFIAVDNIYELAVNRKALIKFAKKLPLGTKIIQVTRIDGEDYPLEVLAKKYGLVESESKLSPIRTAEICARLALMNVGSIVEIFENETRIVVSRGRSLGSGGMSQARYQRNIRGLILRVTREIKEKLEKNGLDYDIFFRKSDSGLEWSLFIVYASREKLYGLIRPKKGHDVQVIIEPIVKSELLFRSLSGDKVEYYRKLRESARHIIVGIDPGITTGIAVIDFSGSILSIKSGRELSRSAVIEFVSNYGKPVVITTDVAKAPNFVKKIASALSAVLYLPERNLTIEEKREIVQGYLERNRLNIKVSNSHERDALAAAIKAYQHYLPKFKQVEDYVKELPFKVPLSQIKALVVKGKTIKEAVQQYIERVYSSKVKCSEKVPAQPASEQTKLLEKISNYINRINELELENLKLKEQVNKLISEKEEIIQTIDFMRTQYFKEIMKDRTFYTLQMRLNKANLQLREKEREIELLKKKLEYWKGMALDLAARKAVAIPRIKVLSLSALSEMEEFSSESIFVDNLSFVDNRALKKLKDRGARLVLTCSNVNRDDKFKFAENNLAVVSLKVSVLYLSDRFVVLPRDTYDSIKEQGLKELENLRDLIIEKKIEEILDEYRKERIKILLNKE